MDQQRVLDVLRQVIDPEVGINIVDLGLVYGVEIDENVGEIRLRLTMTSPACPLGEQIAEEAASMVENEVAGVRRATWELVWEPFWTPARMSEVARTALGWSPVGP